MPKVGSTWKMNVTRVQREVEIKDGAYVKKLGTNGRPAQPGYSCWSVPGLINFHYPERWGIVRFADENETNLQFLNVEAEQLKLTLWKYYYLQQDYKAKNGKYATDLAVLQSAFPGVTFKDIQGLKLLATDLQFTLQKEDTKLKMAASVDHDSKFVLKMLP